MPTTVSDPPNMRWKVIDRWFIKSPRYFLESFQIVSQEESPDGSV